MDELFALFNWNQGIGHFSSELAQSAVFKAYIIIMIGEKKGKSKKEIMAIPTETFGEKNPETGFSREKYTLRTPNLLTIIQLLPAGRA